MRNLFISLFANLGKLILLLAGLAFVTAISLFVVGGYLATWPIMRLSPQERRIHSLVGLGTAILGTIRAYQDDPASVRTPDEPGEVAPNDAQ